VAFQDRVVGAVQGGDASRTPVASKVRPTRVAGAVVRQGAEVVRAGVEHGAGLGVEHSHSANGGDAVTDEKVDDVVVTGARVHCDPAMGVHIRAVDDANDGGRRAYPAAIKAVLRHATERAPRSHVDDRVRAAGVEGGVVAN